MRTQLVVLATLCIGVSSSFSQKDQPQESSHFPSAAEPYKGIKTCESHGSHEYVPPSTPQDQSKSILTNPQVYVQSIHNVIAKWEAGSVYRFDIGTTAGGDDIYQGHLLWATDKHTIGHSFKELQNYALGQGTAFNVGDVFYLNLYSTTNTLDTAFQCQFVWEDLGNAANNITITVETNYGLNGAPPFAAWQAAQMMAFYNLVNPIIIDIFGPPSRNHNVNIVNDAFATNTNTYYNGPNQVNTSFQTNGDGDLDQPRLMVHELIHAYRDNVTLSSNDEWHYDSELSGFEEGMAEAVAILVMDRFAELYPNFWNGEEFRIHWNHARGMPFEWDYDFQNHKQITTQDFFSSDIATGSHWVRYGVGAAAMRKCYIEDNDFFKNFNAAYYAALNADHALVPSRVMITNIMASVKPTVERTPTLTWIDDQRILDCTIDPGKKVFMLSFTALSWNSFQHDNRIFFLETHQNGMEWRWNSSDAAGLNEVPDGAANADYAWTHQQNNVGGTMNFLRDWNNTTWGTKPITANGHWVTDAGGPNAGGTLLGPNQGPNPYFVGGTFTRDHEQDNCTAVPGCGKRAWAIGSQDVYTSTSDAVNMWPMLVSQGGTVLDQRAELNMTESGLFRFDIQFNDPLGPVVSETYYRLLGNTFIASPNKGLIGGIYSPTQNAVPGRLFVEHEDHGIEPEITIVSNAFKADRTWTSILEPLAQYQGGRTDRRYSDPGQVHAIYVNTDCSEKKIDFRTIGYGDGLDGTEMLLFNRDEFEDIIFTEAADITIPPGSNFDLTVTNNFPDILNDDPRITYSWLDPLGNSISTDTNYTFTNAQITDEGTYQIEVDFFGCPVFALDVEVAVTVTLPVEIANFDAELLENDKVELDWESLVEINCDSYVIERSIDGKFWSPIAEINGAGTSYSANQYRTFDEHPFLGLNYYKLVQFDFDGTRKEVGIDQVMLASDIQLYPNPTNGETFISGREIENASLVCFNSLGQEITIDFERSANQISFATDHLASGLYTIQVMNKLEVKTIQFVIR